MISDTDDKNGAYGTYDNGVYNGEDDENNDAMILMINTMYSILRWSDSQCRSFRIVVKLMLWLNG